MMNPNSFSVLGYLSVLLWLAVPMLWILRHRIPTPGWLPLALALLATTFATINSRTHVSRIDVEIPDPAANALDIAAEKRKALEAARGDDVADIRFAEDGADDFIDKAGMDESERKYLDHISENQDPASTRQKKQRGEQAAESNDLDDLIDTEKPAAKLSTDAIPEAQETRPPILMSEPHVTTARKLNKLNLNASYIVILLGLSYFFLDHLTRANSYTRASSPLPLPAAWRNALTPLPAIFHRPATPRRDLPAELAWLVRQGDVFLCFTDETITLPPTLPRLGKNIIPIDIIPIESELITPSFIFEALWFGRACFIANNPALFPSLLEQLSQRHTSRARPKQNIHLIWNLSQAPSEKDLATFERLAPSTNFSLFLSKK